jgi:antitoxin MazE
LRLKERFGVVLPGYPNQDILRDEDIQENAMQVSKWGNSLAVRLPRKLVEEIGLVPGDEIAIVEASKERIAIEKIDRRAKFLEQMEQFRWPAPDGCKFDRDEANER